MTMAKKSSVLVVLCLVLFGGGCTTIHLSGKVSTTKEIKSVVRDFESGDKTKLKELGGGLSDSGVYMFKSSGGQKYVLKRGGSWPDHDGKLMELALHKICASNGVAPQILYVDNERDPKTVVMDYIDGRLLVREDFYNDDIIDGIIENLKYIHDAPVKQAFKKRSLLCELQNSIDRIKKKKIILPSKFDHWYKRLFMELSKFKPLTLVLCHCDLKTKNILVEREKKVYFIDFQNTLCWEPLFDVAHLFYRADINDSVVLRKFLKKYFGREATIAEMRKVVFYKSVFAFVSGQYRLRWLQNTTSAELDRFMEQKTVSSSYYLKKGDISKEKFKKLSQSGKIQYVLSFFKDFLRFGKEVGINFYEMAGKN
jgi:thiamine kinase-like enzyme